MTKPRPKPPDIEDLPELYLDLKLSMERLEGIVRQLQAEGTRATLDSMAWKELETVKKQVKRLEQHAKLDVT
jgi:hypothetical protein